MTMQITVTIEDAREWRDAFAKAVEVLGAMEAQGFSAALTIGPGAAVPVPVPAKAPEATPAPVVREPAPRPEKQKAPTPPKPHPNAWTGEDDERLVAMHREGKSVAEIGAALGRPKTAVNTRTSVLRKRGVDIPARLPGGAISYLDRDMQGVDEIAAEQAAMAGLDDAAVIAFARARDAGQSIPAARMDALAHMRRRQAAGSAA